MMRRALTLLSAISFASLAAGPAQAQYYQPCYNATFYNNQAHDVQVGYAAGACDYYGPTEVLIEGYRTHWVSYEQNGWCYDGVMYPL
jgi:hypothetical protein